MATTTYVPIETYTLNSSASSITFGSGGTLSQNYTDLVIVANTKNTANDGDEVGIRFNGDSGSNYSRTRLFGNGSSASSSRSSGTNKGALQINSTSNFTPFIAHIQNYSSNAVYKTVISKGGSGGYMSAYVSLWRGSTGSSTEAITSITLLPDSGTTFTSGCTFTLYGIANAQIKAPKAKGGIVMYDSNYFYHVFTKSGTFTANQTMNADVLVVAGGGGGGSYGGGGAGGVCYQLNKSLSATNYTVTIGAGGSGGAAAGGAYGTAGENSVFGSITALGGGRGPASTSGDTGGSGSGGSYNSPSANLGGASTQTDSDGATGYGNAGGNGYYDGASIASGGGGGGAGGAGGNADPVNGRGGAGGVGFILTADWLNATGTGVNGYIAGGGGGGSIQEGGITSGGGGLGATASAGGGNATANTGGGGGGGRDQTGGTGGSGLVIVRYLKA